MCDNTPRRLGSMTNCWLLLQLHLFISIPPPPFPPLPFPFDRITLNVCTVSQTFQLESFTLQRHTCFQPNTSASIHTTKTPGANVAPIKAAIMLTHTYQPCPYNTRTCSEDKSCTLHSAAESTGHTTRFTIH